MIYEVTRAKEGLKLLYAIFAMLIHSSPRLGVFKNRFRLMGLQRIKVGVFENRSRATEDQGRGVQKPIRIDRRMEPEIEEKDDSW
nr:hypothetical protein CFP56_33352 [Quercus suber]